MCINHLRHESLDSENSVADGEENDSSLNDNVLCTEDIISCMSEDYEPTEYDTDATCTSPAAPSFSPLSVT